MKNFTLLILFFCSMICYSQSYAFLHIGDQDKPMPDIIISVNPINQATHPETNIYQVDKETFAIISLYIANYEVNKNDILKSELPYGTYNLICYSVENKNIDTKYLLGTQNSLPFFKGLLPCLKKYPEIEVKINGLIKRLTVTTP
ncbi:hypothetical protein [Flavobacterium sp.]|uniref:hypothetical protein n=1 Tax=Flavobacterium sp. TaxID=239 RepID=UPI003A91BE84